MKCINLWWHILFKDYCPFFWLEFKCLQCIQKLRLYLKQHRNKWSYCNVWETICAAHLKYTKWTWIGTYRTQPVRRPSVNSCNKEIEFNVLFIRRIVQSYCSFIYMTRSFTLSIIMSTLSLEHKNEQIHYVLLWMHVWKFSPSHSTGGENQLDRDEKN